MTTLRSWCPGRWAFTALLVGWCCAVLGRPAAVAATAPADAATIYNESCIGCHGASGSGTPLGKSLKVRDLHAPEVRSMGSAALAVVISNGRGNMPAFGKKLSEAEIAKLVQYVRTLGRSQP